jgi:uncharacterized protein (TIGR00730 family)
MNFMKSVCVFCGSGTGTKSSYPDAARELGRLIAARGLNLVYGGSNIGLMGMVSAAARDAGAGVTGVIPRKIADHVPEQAGIRLEVVSGMHHRKARMYELSDGFIALPGGIGTLEETFEAWTWNQLGYHSKPLALLNVDGFYDSLLIFLDGVAADGFVRMSQRQSLLVDSDPGRLLEKMEHWKAPEGLKWENIKPST